MLRRVRTRVLAVALLTAASTQIQPGPSAFAVTSPAQQFGAAIGDDYFLATYTQLEEYWQRLDRESPRLSLVDIGATEEGRRQWMAVVSAPENLRQLDRYRTISGRLAGAEGLSEADARALAATGKTIVCIAGGLHGTEVLGAQQLIETVYRLVSADDAETTRLLRDVIVLLMHANPDGHELAATWYMREPEPSRRTLAGLPRLYHKYAGHDNNRDFYLISQAETRNMSRVLYRDWVPQIVYDHHQAPLARAVMVAPPFREPTHYLFDPLVPSSIDRLGAAIRRRLAAEGKDGVTSDYGYSTWWNGGLRTAAYFHNQIGLLTETDGGPTPLPGARWRFRDAVAYSVSANLAVLDAAARGRERWLYNAYQMGRRSIDRGSRDSWTASPHRPDGGAPDPRLRDPRGYILPAGQRDFPTATKFVNALLSAGVMVSRATRPFAVSGRTYPAGSYVVKTAQAFRPHVLDMFEPQDHPDDGAGAEGTRTAPYDATGWTLAFQMGVEFHRVLDPFDGPFEPIEEIASPAGRVEPALSDRVTDGYRLSGRENDSVAAVNRLLRAGAAVYWTMGQDGSFFVESSPGVVEILRDAVRRHGITVTPASPGWRVDARRLLPARIGLVDRYGGLSSSGWIRWILERFEFPHDIVYPPALDEGNLRARYDVLILPSEATPGRPPQAEPLPDPRLVPAEYRSRIGEITTRTTLPELRRFVEAGGTLVAIGRAAAAARYLGIPVSSPMATHPSPEYLIQGAVLRAAVDNTRPPASGLASEVDLFFDNSPVFRLDAGSAAKGVRPIAWFASASPLRSGRARGQAYLQGTAAAVEAPLGAGRVLLFGPEITFRGQPHGSFKLLFHSILYSRVGPAAPALSPESWAAGPGPY